MISKGHNHIKEKSLNDPEGFLSGQVLQKEAAKTQVGVAGTTWHGHVSGAPVTNALPSEGCWVRANPCYYLV